MAAAAGSAVAEREHRKALPTAPGVVVDVNAECRVLMALAESAKRPARAAVGALKDSIANQFDHTAARELFLGVPTSREGSASAEKAAAAELAERRAVVESWARQGWPKRVLYAMAHVTEWRRDGPEALVREYLESKVATAVLRYDASGEAVVDGAAAASMAFEEDEYTWRLVNEDVPDATDLPPSTGAAAGVNTPPAGTRARADWQDNEFVSFFKGDHERRLWMPRILVVGTDACPKAEDDELDEDLPGLHCDGPEGCNDDCEQGAEMIWNGLGVVTSNRIDGYDSLVADGPSADQAEGWNCTKLFTEFREMVPRPRRALIRLDTSFVVDADHSAVLFNLPLADAFEDDWDIAAVVLSAYGQD